VSRPAPKSKSGSALLMVLAVVVVLAVLVTEFGASMKGEVKAAAGLYEGEQNVQLALSALALARLELARRNTALYADEYGNAFFVGRGEDHEAQIEELMAFRHGLGLGRGRASYRFVHKYAAIDPNELAPGAWHRLLEVACGIAEGEERSALVDAVLDWIDPDNMRRASGAEEEVYQALENPRHAKNAPLSSHEELLLVYGFTPRMLHGDGFPERLEDGMLVGGGLLRFFIGDNSPEGRAARRYVLTGALPADVRRDREEQGRFRKLQQRPMQLWLVAQGFFAGESIEAADVPDAARGVFNDPAYPSRHIILLRLVYSPKDDAYRIGDMSGNAPAEAVERLFAHGVPGEEWF